MKRQRQNVKRALRNQSALSRLRTVMKGVAGAVQKKDVQTAQAALQAAMSALHQASAKSVVHHRYASRHISRLSSLIQSLAH